MKPSLVVSSKSTGTGASILSRVITIKFSIVGLMVSRDWSGHLAGCAKVKFILQVNTERLRNVLYQSGCEARVTLTRRKIVQ